MAEARLRRNINRQTYPTSADEPPFYMPNGRGFSSNANASTDDTATISTFRRALPQFLAAIMFSRILAVYGMTLGFPTIVIPAIQGGDGREPSDIVLNREEISWFSSINLICVPLGCLFSGILTQPIGKRRAMQLVNLPILASWLLFHFSTRTEHLYAALCLSGLGGGLMEAPVLTYVAEITEPKYRGILSALGSTCVITGVFIQFIMGSLMDWRTVAAVSSAFPVISIIALCFVPESPIWLIREQRFREAVKALQWLRGWVPEHYIEEEFNELYDELIVQPALEEAEENQGITPSIWKSRLRMFRKRSFLAPFLLVAFTFFVGHFSGKTTLQTYAVQIFHTLKAPINKYHATILLGVVEMIATIMCVFLIHFTGKRPLVLISTAGVALCMFGTATYAHYVKVVPGFAVNNVVVNASSIVPNENIITQANITKIFETESNALLKTEFENMTEGSSDLDAPTTTIASDNEIPFDVTTIMSIFNRSEEVMNSINRTKREESTADFFDINGRSIVYTTSYLNIADFGDDNDTSKQSNIKSEIELSTTSATVTKKVVDIVPSSNQVANEILLPVPKQKRNDLVWLPLVLLLGAAFFAHFGIRMIPWILIGEVFPAPVRSTASGLVSGLGYIFGFLANKLFLQMLTALTMPGTFWFYSAVALAGAFLLYFVLPETEGRTLAEIEAHFSKKSKINLLKKSCRSDLKNHGLQLHHFQNPQTQTETKVITLQQSDFATGAQMVGRTNMAFEENNTTHL